MPRGMCAGSAFLCLVHLAHAVLSCDLVVMEARREFLLLKRCFAVVVFDLFFFSKFASGCCRWVSASLRAVVTLYVAADVSLNSSLTRRGDVWTDEEQFATYAVGEVQTHVCV